MFVCVVFCLFVFLQLSSTCSQERILQVYSQAESALSEIEQLRERFRRESRNVELIESMLNLLTFKVLDQAADVVDTWTQARLGFFECIPPGDVMTPLLDSMDVLHATYKKHIPDMDAPEVGISLESDFPIQSLLTSYIFPILSELRVNLVFPNPMLPELIPSSSAMIDLTPEMIDMVSSYKPLLPSIQELLGRFSGGSSKLIVEFSGDSSYDDFNLDILPGFTRNFGGYRFSTNFLPPFNSTIEYRGVSVSEEHSEFVTIHQVPYFLSRMHAMNSSISLYKSINHFEPDILSISPATGNCHLAVRLVTTSTVRPRLLLLPFDPTKGASDEAGSRTDHFEWWRRTQSGFVEGGAEIDAELLEWGRFIRDEVGQPTMEFSAEAMTRKRISVHPSSLVDGQCSLSEAVAALKPHGYVLVSAASPDLGVFAQTRLEIAPELRASEVLDAVWTKSRLRPYFKLYEVTHPGSVSSPVKAGEEEYPLPYFTAKPLAEFVLREGKRGRCSPVDGFCECYPPFVGELCEAKTAVEPTAKAVADAVIHYLIPDRATEISELCAGLGNLYTTFNRKFNYPVVVFHDGLSEESRTRILSCASGNAVWFLRVVFPEPPSWVERRLKDTQNPKSSRGYQDAIRFRSQPLFEDELFDRYSIAMTLDADSWFPDTISVDPFRYMLDNRLTAVFPHLGREASSVAVNLHQHTLYYGKLFGHDLRRTQMGKSLIASNYKWYQQIFELDIEVVQVSWLRSPNYKRYFNYLDSLGGWWLYRWGNNPVRTFASLLFLEDRQVGFLRIPYAHQSFCTCGDSGKKCLRAPTGFWTCQGSSDKSTSQSGSQVPAPAADIANVLELMRPWQGGDTKDIEDMVFNPGGSDSITVIENP